MVQLIRILTLCVIGRIREVPISKFGSMFSTEFRGKYASKFIGNTLRIEINICEESFYFCQNVTSNQAAAS
jgi:hypothetical protein